MPIIYALSLFAVSPFGKCDGQRASVAHLQWSHSTPALSPDGAWEIRVKPNLKAKNNDSPVYLINCVNGTSAKIMSISRVADVVWGGNGRAFVLVNEPAAGKAEFTMLEITSGHHGLTINHKSKTKRLVDAFLVDQLKSGETAVFRFFRITKFRDNTFNVMVSGVAGKGARGQLRPFCADAKIQLRENRIVRKIILTNSADNMSDKCSYYP